MEICITHIQRCVQAKGGSILHVFGLLRGVGNGGICFVLLLSLSTSSSCSRRELLLIISSVTWKSVEQWYIQCFAVLVQRTPMSLHGVCFALTVCLNLFKLQARKSFTFCETKPNPSNLHDSNCGYLCEMQSTVLFHL